MRSSLGSIRSASSNARTRRVWGEIRIQQPSRFLDDLPPDSLIIEITGADEKIDGLLEILRPFGVLEVARTGCLAMARGVSGRTAAQASGSSTDHLDATVSFSV